MDFFKNPSVDIEAAYLEFNEKMERYIEEMKTESFKPDKSVEEIVESRKELARKTNMIENMDSVFHEVRRYMCSSAAEIPKNIFFEAGQLDKGDNVEKYSFKLKEKYYHFVEESSSSTAMEGEGFIKTKTISLFDDEDKLIFEYEINTEYYYDGSIPSLGKDIKAFIPSDWTVDFLETYAKMKIASELSSKKLEEERAREKEKETKQRFGIE